MLTFSEHLNTTVGWGLVLAAFISGAIIGLGFHRESFLGGYNSFRRRLLRLGHIAFAALGMLNLVYAVGPATHPLASLGLIAGGILMPTVCLLTAWRKEFRHLFFLPVIALVTAVTVMVGVGWTKGSETESRDKDETEFRGSVRSQTEFGNESDAGGTLRRR